MDTFISYATEDEQCASEIAGMLKSRGFSVWYAPLVLRVGDTLLAKINDGLAKAKSGILLISQYYIDKKWTNYELDVLFRQHIEKEKRIFPIWHNVEKSRVEQWHPGLSGIVAARTSNGLMRVGESIVQSLAEKCRICGVAPCWESPFHRFLNGDGELHANSENGGSFTIWEALEFSDDKFPIWIDGKQYHPEDLAFRAAQTLAQRRDVAVRWVGESRVSAIEDRCVKLGYNPEIFR
jgi:hypothetical protein